MVKIPFNTRILLILGLGWTFVASNSGLISFALPLIKSEWGLKGTQTGILLNSFLIGMLVGAFLVGRVADVLGRRPSSIFSLLILAAATALCSVSRSWIDMAILRFFAGMGATGYMVAASTFLSEFSPRRIRGRSVALLESGWAFGWLLASYLGKIIAPSLGWRPVFLVGILPFLASLLIFFLPESPRYLLIKGKEKEAEVLAKIAKVELKVGKRKRIKLTDLFSGKYLKRTTMLWIHWFCIVLAYWGIFLWFPQILYARGLSLIKTLQYSFIITLAQIPGYWSGAYLIEKIGRKKSLSIYMALAGLGSLLYWFSRTNIQALLGAIVISFFNLGAWGITYAYTPELYPTPIRASGSGWANSFGRVGGIVGPYLVGLILDLTNSYAFAFIIFAAAHILSAATVALLGIETMGRSLEEIQK